MIRKALPWTGVLVLFLLASPLVQAQARDNSFEVGYFGGVNFYANELKLQNGAMFGLWIGYNITSSKNTSTRIF